MVKNTKDKRKTYKQDRTYEEGGILSRVPAKI